MRRGGEQGSVVGNCQPNGVLFEATHRVLPIPLRGTEAYPLNTRASSSGQRNVEEPVWSLVVGSGESVAVGDPWQYSSSGSIAEDRGTMRWRREAVGAKTPS